MERAGIAVVCTLVVGSEKSVVCVFVGEEQEANGEQWANGYLYDSKAAGCFDALQSRCSPA